MRNHSIVYGEMKVILLILAGVLGVAAGVGHGYLGQTRVIAITTFPSQQAKSLVSAIWQFSATSWALCGVVIGASPWLFSDDTRPIAVTLACLPLCYGLIGNAWITRGRHFGWKLFAMIVILAMLGALLPAD